MATKDDEKLINFLRGHKDVPDEVKKNKQALEQLARYVNEVLKDKNDLNNPQNEGLVRQQMDHMKRMNPFMFPQLIKR